VTSGNVIVAWRDERSGSSSDIYAQCIDPNGITLWPDNGVPVCMAAESQMQAHLVDDGADGAIIVWIDNRNDGYGDLYAQRVSGDGNPLWGETGIPVCSADYYQRAQQLTGDGAGGLIVVWEDYRNGESGALNFDYSDVYAQRVSSFGDVMWTINGVAICDIPAKAQKCPQIAGGNQQGCIVTWEDYRADKYGDIYIQHIGSNGAIQWQEDGLPVCGLPLMRQFAPHVVSDGDGGAIVAWQDRRNWSASKDDIYAQRISAGGDFLWLHDGEAICVASEEQWDALLISDQAGGAIIIWQDRRHFNNEIYSQRIDAFGDIVPTLLLAHSISLAGSTVWLEWTVSDWTAAMEFYVARAEWPVDEYRYLATVTSPGGGDSFVCSDVTCEPGGIYSYRVDVLDEIGRRILFESEPITVPVRTPTRIRNFPNPFSAGTQFHYIVEKRSHISLTIYDAAGRLIKTVVNDNQEQNIGGYVVDWDGRDHAGVFVPSGIYFCKFLTEYNHSTSKIAILR
ncbi:MAG: T9SS type A sorting domain-containing protein, partial [Candidatus Latescibacterota bacterium]